MLRRWFGYFASAFVGTDSILHEDLGYGMCRARCKCNKADIGWPSYAIGYAMFEEDWDGSGVVLKLGWGFHG
jgi:hypothetical protein